MAKQKTKIEFRYYNMPTDQYILPKLGEGWEQEYGIGYQGMLHFHNYFEIGFCYHGHGELIVEDRDYRYSDRMISLIPANIPHTTNSDPGNICKWEYLFIDVESFVNNEMKDCRMLPQDIIKIVNRRGTLKTEENHSVMTQIVLRIIEECRAESLYYKESIKGYLRALIIEIMRLDEEREQARKSVKLSRYVETAIEYIGKEYAEEIKIADIAQICGLSESHFRRIFEETMSMKPVDYINLVRIDKACELIRKEDISMEDVGFRVGYLTPSTFNRNFKRLTGMTPYQWKFKDTGGLTNFEISAKKGWEA